MIKVKHPSKDINQIAKHIVDLATGNVDKENINVKSTKKAPKLSKTKK